MPNCTTSLLAQSNDPRSFLKMLSHFFFFFLKKTPAAHQTPLGRGRRGCCRGCRCAQSCVLVLSQSLTFYESQSIIKSQPKLQATLRNSAQHRTGRGAINADPDRAGFRLVPNPYDALAVTSMLDEADCPRIAAVNELALAPNRTWLRRSPQDVAGLSSDDRI